MQTSADDHLRKMYTDEIPMKYAGKSILIIHPLVGVDESPESVLGLVDSDIPPSPGVDFR
jgi:hypothetical protein